MLHLSCLWIALLAVCSAPLRAEAPLTVSAAISLKDSLADIARQYEKQTGQAVRLNLGASGQLASQIIDGAPVDVFISADRLNAAKLEKAGLVDPGSTRIVAGNRLVLVAPADAKSPPRGFQQLSDASIKRIAIGRPQIVPAGDYAVQVFKALKVDSIVRDKLVYAMNVRQVLDYVAQGEVDAAVVYASDAKSAGATIQMMAVAPAELHDPIVYPAAVIKGSKNVQQAMKFVDFLLSDEAQKILLDYGFISPQQPATNPTRNK